MEKSKKTKRVICPHCKGNGYITVPYQLAKEEVHAQCGVCDSEGELDAEQRDDLYVDSDGIHRLQQNGLRFEPMDHGVKRSNKT